MQTSKLFILIALSTVLSSCSLFHRKLDSTQEHTTETGFKFTFPMSGEWFEAEKPTEGRFMVGEKPSENGSTRMAVVRHGIVDTKKKYSNKELLAGFQKDIELESKSGKLEKVKNKFSQKKHAGAECLYFDQVGEDKMADGIKIFDNRGMICMHPKKYPNYVWMSISEKRKSDVPSNRSMNDDEKKFFDSLQFLN